MFLILIDIEACSLLNTLWITKQVGMGRFSQYSLVFFFFLNVSIRFLPLLFLKFQCSTSFICPVTETYYCELRLEKEKNIFKVNNLLLKSLFPRRCFFFKFNNGNWLINEICSKLIIKNPEWRQWRLGLNFSTFTKDFYCFRYFIYTLFRFHPLAWPQPSVIKSI